MGYIIIAIFFIAVILSYTEEYLGKYKLPLYLLIGMSLILSVSYTHLTLPTNSLV